jgi:hypothetical protein
MPTKIREFITFAIIWLMIALYGAFIVGNPIFWISGLTALVYAIGAIGLFIKWKKKPELFDTVIEYRRLKYPEE